MTTDSLHVTVVVPTYNGRELLEVVLPTLAAQTYPDFSILVADDASSDDTLAYLAEHWPQVRVLSCDVNRGFAANVNAGIAAADSDLVALVNNDLELEPRWLEELVRGLLEDDRAGSATGKLLRYDRRDVIDAAGDALTWPSACLNRGAGEIDRGQYDTPEPVFSACAGAALYRREALDAVGPFDVDFGSYLEDVDWGFRAQLRGFTARYVPSAVGYHMGGATLGRRRRLAGRLQRRNQLLLVVKDYPGAALLRHGPKVALHHLGWLVASARDGMFLEHVRAWAEVLRALPATLRKRRAVQRTRRVDMRYLDTVIPPDPWVGDTPLARLRSVMAAAAPLWRDRDGR